MNNLKQIGLASRMYADDQNDALPRSSHQGESWVGSLQPYTAGTNLWRCPRDTNKTRRYSYAINDFLLPATKNPARPDFSRLMAVPAPTETFFMGECADGYANSDHFHFDPATDGDYSPLAFGGEATGQVAVRRHLNSANYLFVDWHVERLNWNLVKPKLTSQGSRFVNPAGKELLPLKLPMKTQLVLLLATIGIVTNGHHAQAQHGHLNAGAVSTNQNAQLIWANGADFIATSGYVNTLSYTNGDRFAGYYQGNITLTALPQTPGNASPDPAAAALGAFLQFSMACLEGPTGGTFGFWDVGSTNPSLSLVPGQTSTNLWRLTESDGSPGSDPYGHIHGRRFSATQPGIYKVGFTAFDTSTNGTGGEPIHTPSQQLPVWFQAGVNIQSVEPDYEEGHVHVRFGATAGFSWQMEASKFLGPQADWQPAGTPFTGNDYLIEMIHEGSPGELRFYRLRGTPVTP